MIQVVEVSILGRGKGDDIVLKYTMVRHSKSSSFVNTMSFIIIIKSFF